MQAHHECDVLLFMCSVINESVDFKTITKIVSFCVLSILSVIQWLRKAAGQVNGALYPSSL
jgi:hypothetical protein